MAECLDDVEQPGLTAALLRRADDQARRVRPRGLGVRRGDPEDDGVGGLGGRQDDVAGERRVDGVEQRQ